MKISIRKPFPVSFHPFSHLFIGSLSLKELSSNSLFLFLKLFETLLLHTLLTSLVNICPLAHSVPLQTPPSLLSLVLFVSSLLIPELSPLLVQNFGITSHLLSAKPSHSLHLNLNLKPIFFLINNYLLALYFDSFPTCIVSSDPPRLFIYR